MKTYDFDDSPVMRELERLEIAKNGIPECEIQKKASVEDPDSLICKLSSLSKSLRKIGKYNEADSLDIKIVKYVTAENTHLYRVHDEDGEDLIDFAHSDGAVKVHEAKEGYGVVDTQTTQHKKIVDMISKQPTGKYASISFLNEVASILKIAGDDKLNAANEDLKFAKEYLSQITNKMAQEITNNNWVDNLGFIITNDDRRAAPNNIDFVSPDQTFSTTVGRDNSDLYPDFEKDKGWGLFVAFNPDAEVKAKEWTISDAEFGTFWGPVVGKANKNLQQSINNIISSVKNINKIEGVSADFISFVDNLSNTLKILNDSRWLVFKLYDSNDEQFKRYDDGLKRLEEGINKLIPIKNRESEKYLSLINSVVKDISTEIHRIGIPFTLFDNGFPSYNSIKKSINFSNPEDLIGRLKKILSLLKTKGSVKYSSVKYNFKKNADALDDLANALNKLPEKQQVPASIPSSAPISAAPPPVSAPVSTRPLTPSKTRVQSVNEWKAKVDKQYVESVNRMQSFLVNTLYSNATNIFKSIIDKPGVTGLISNLKETAAKNYEGDFDIDAQWGPGTSKAVEAAKKLLSMFPNNSGVENIKSGEDVKVNGKSGYLYYAGYDLDKQKEVAEIASKNLNIMNDILSANNLGMFSSSKNKEESVNGVLDLIPKDSNMWGDPSFLSLGIGDKNPMPEGVPSALITKQDLSNLVNFDRWLKAYDIVSGSGMGSLFSDGGLNYHAFKAYIYRIKTRAEAMVRHASEATKAKAQEYFSDVSSLFARLDDAWDAYKESNPDADDKKPVSPRTLEIALLGGSPGVGSQTRPSQQGGSGLNGKGGEGGEGSEGFDSTVNRRSRQEEVQIPIGYSIQPMYLQKYYFGTFKDANELAPIIDIQTIKNIYSDPYGAYESIVGNANVPWSQMLSDLRYNLSDNAVSANGGVALKDIKGNTIKYINLSQTSATRVRIESEWKLKKLIEYLDSIQNSLIKINKEYYSRVMRLMPGKEGLERATANNEAVIEWNQAIEYGITSIRREINNLRTGKAKGFQI